MACAETGSLLDHFSALRDPRQGGEVLYLLPEILLLVLCATLAGANDFVAVRLWGEQALPFLRRLLPYEDGLPSHDTLGDVMNALDPELFKECFLSWVETLRSSPSEADGPEIIAVDGKTSRRTHNRAKGREALHLVSAWACGQRLVLGQEATADKSNEIWSRRCGPSSSSSATRRSASCRRIPRLLERLALEGALVTIDAMGTQTEIARTIRRKGGDYLLALKENWPATHAEVEKAFADPETTVERSKTVDPDHGRIEVRRHAVCHDVDFLYSDRRHPGEFAMPDVAMIGMVDSHTERAGKIEQEPGSYPCSPKLDA